MLSSIRAQGLEESFTDSILKKVCNTSDSDTYDFWDNTSQEKYVWRFFF